ncbi:MAG: sigma-70 family RNA polymerase sigma factor [Candidatus Thiodiazotropha sp.]|nr:sigma-70 family RNA polymerase sigma factor [Candidatus Thiodiazotropha sp.]
MAVNWGQSIPEVDWELLILEVRTAPEKTLKAAQDALYLAVHPWMDDIATRFAQRHGVAECDIETLYNLGIAQIMSKVDQFEPQTDDSTELGRQFKAWVTIVCRNRWYDEYRKASRDYERLRSHQAALADEQKEHWDSEFHHRDPEDWGRMVAAYQHCLSKYPEHYQNAILETEALRQEQETPKSARGRAGEAAAIADRHGVKSSTVRKYRERLKQCVRDEYSKDSDQ